MSTSPSSQPREASGASERPQLAPPLASLSIPSTGAESTPSKKRKHASSSGATSASSSSAVPALSVTSPSLPSNIATTSSGKPPVGIRELRGPGGGGENPILVALGSTPRGTTSQFAGFPDPDVLELGATAHSKRSSLESMTTTASQAPAVAQAGAASLKRKREEHEEDDETVKTEFVAYAREHVHNQEAGEEGFSIDPSDRAVEHRANKLVRREILIASPAANDEDEWEGSATEAPMDDSMVESKPAEHIDLQPVDMILHIFSFLVSSEDFPNMGLVSRRWRELTSRRSLCRALPSILPDGSVNWLNFQNLGIKNKGTEGTCFKCHQRSTGRILAMKKARVFPKGEGVPYYMLRELAVLKGIKHDHIATLEMISLARDELHVFFPFVDKTLHEIINPTGDPSGGRVLSERVIRRLLHQLLDAIAYCHRRGVLHRNLKPKHLLIKTADLDTLEDAVLQISDFALVRATGIPKRTYTMEVVTLWYRPPEILMGVRGYSSAVDIWSVGCIFAEMAQGKPLFTGISEIDQLFQIFSKLSTPTSESWPGFRSLPNYHFEFPNWRRRPLNRLFPNISDLGIDLLSKLLTYNPDHRITAEDALRHPYFSEAAPSIEALTPTIPMDQMAYVMNRLRSSTIPEHVELFHSHLRQTERESWKEIKYLSRQKTLRPAHRSMLVDWLIEVVDVFEMCLRTAFLAVNYTDRFLDIVMVKKTRFQLLGATCLHVASKCEDVSYIGVEDLAMCADNVYTSAEVLKMEEKLLNTLNFTLSIPTALDFLNIYERMIPPIQKKTSMLAHYLLELALQEYQFLKFLPSVVATCCLSMAMYTVDGFPMSEDLADACQYRWMDLRECMSELQALYSSSPSNNLAVIKKRYSKAERCQVATIMPPATFNMAF
ncbi:hypothetical protein Poli38472_009157 [Pythium oligandrum]|uniref:Cyclin-F n=1 Tax=Pythium oligandrum TaxID=41045 RepID=A0A8K1CKM1_PYTOL|nr:hypothetical protein Poli38472_009157 [Pythium oligandrum]|eukprot:TMW64990.1 hypothetical protein Poli38472_009157 [Pythium oligandrum]